MATLDDLDTPSLVLDRAKVVANATRLKAHLATLGVPLRLHVKTAKCAEVAATARKLPVASPVSRS